MWLDLTPLKKNRDFRFLYFGQLISFFGTMMSMVAIPYQVYALTNSTFAVGLIGLVELVPLLLTAFIGGSLADGLDRRKLLIRAEIGMALCCLLLIINAYFYNTLSFIYLIAACLSALNGLHRPSLDALTPRLVSQEEIQAVSVLSMFKSTVSVIGAPAVAGMCIANLGLTWAFIFDFLTFVFSIGALACIHSLPFQKERQGPNLKNIPIAIRYALSRQELLGTYLVDFMAMISAMPNALFPAIAAGFGGTKVLGWLYTGPAIGAFIITLFSGWTKKVKQHGAAVAIAAFIWGGAIACIGMHPSFLWIMTFLVLSGAADCVSGIFRVTIWNETIPDNVRGRMASLEVISYSSGPLIGNAQVGFLASMTSPQMAILIGGIFCMISVIVCVFLLPIFWSYRQAPLTERSA